MSGRLRRIASQTEFERLLGTSTRPVLVDASASWCGPCQRLTPILEDFAAGQDGVEVVTLDTDELTPLARRLGPSSIPRMYLFDRGVMQLEVAGLKQLAWLEDMVGGYPALGIIRPDGWTLPPQTPARAITLPAPDAGSARLVLVNGDDGSRQGPLPAPCTVELPAGSHVGLSLSVEAIDSGYLGALDPTWVDDVFVVGGGTLTAAHLVQLARLSSLRRLDSSRSAVAPDDLLILKDLPRLRTLALGEIVPVPGGADVAAVPLADGAFSHVSDGRLWLAPGLKDARLAAGLPEHPARARSWSPVSVTGRLVRRDDGKIDLTVWVEIPAGWYAYPPGSAEGVPVSLALTSGHDVVQPLAAQSDGDHLQGRAVLSAVLDGPDEARLDVTVQVCNGEVCLPPDTTRLVVPMGTRR